MKGTVIGQYRVTRVLGRGGMGMVYEAEHTLLGRTAAVKVLLPDLSSKQEVVQRFFNEARAATAIKHPGIVEIYDFGWTSDGAAFIVMELLQGESLRTRRTRGAMGYGAALALTRQIAGALAAAHAKGIVHRDLKPDNVYVVPDPEVPGGERIKLLDFGIAKLADSASGQHKTRTGAVIGTPAYMAPEQCRGVAIDSRADLYSLGCILFELCCGRPPFVGEGEGDVLAAHIHVPPPALSSVARGVPAELEALVHRLLAKPPADRVQTAEEVIRLIDAVNAATGSGPRAFPHEGSAGGAAAFRHEPSASAAAVRHEGSAAGAAAFRHEPSASAAAFRHDPSSVAVTVLPGEPSGVAVTVFPNEPSAGAAARYPAAPAPARAPVKGTIYSDTTLSSAASTHGMTALLPSRRRFVIAGVAVGAVVIGMIVAIAIGRGGDVPPPSTASTSATGSTSPEAEPAPEPPPSAPEPAQAPAAQAPASQAPASQAPAPGPPPVAPTLPADPAPSPAAPTPPDDPPPATDAKPERPPAKDRTAPPPPKVTVAKRRPEPPEPATVDVTLVSTPPGAEVLQDGKRLGKTPLKVPLPRKDRNVRLVLKLTGYGDQTITVSTGASSKKTVQLTPVAHNKVVNPFD